MFDQTGVAVLFFALLKLGLWIGVVLYAIAIVRRIVGATRETTSEEIGRAILTHLNSVIIWIVIFVATAIVTGIETGYRPKTVIAPRNEYAERIRAQEGQSLPSVQEAPARPSWDAIEEKNKAENETARREFEALPDAD